MIGLKASWAITWGVIPGEQAGEKIIQYTSEDYDADQAETWKAGDLSIFERKRLEAMGVSQVMQDHRINNWVITGFIWY